MPQNGERESRRDVDTSGRPGLEFFTGGLWLISMKQVTREQRRSQVWGRFVGIVTIGWIRFSCIIIGFYFIIYHSFV